MSSLLPPVPLWPGFLPVFAKIKLAFESGTCTLYPGDTPDWLCCFGGLGVAHCRLRVAWHGSMLPSAAFSVLLRAKSFHRTAEEDFRMSWCEAGLEFLKKRF